MSDSDEEFDNSMKKEFVCDNGDVNIEKHFKFMEKYEEEEFDKNILFDHTKFEVLCADTNDNGMLNCKQMEMLSKNNDLFDQNKIKEYVTNLFKWLDKNEDGFLEGTELAKFQKYYERTAAKKKEKNVIKLMDTDKDGKISSEEFVTFFVNFFES
ncbi:hypothetical protein EIN_365810 [Entamoeba invadens IP1]|uniref:EF-hand domain-containing protein n=1 Tax=Entamoeba invadens IP1 TaxID=370355 RepID=L7FJJ5_ENTIV|nr:hypothetical protein EIN_365810 [Entamoeba invadens IP1]ELP84406.1 hypothetical protein EIN_365810 [Entamoeba invadens IP1]|eukprot:XP_004183752.1 hypothetical protein EIN_365810 [Entamoeba invadens IP1]